MGLQQFERKLERLVEGVFAKAFRGGVQPVEVARRMTREMDNGRMVGRRGAIAPNAFTVTVSPQDRERLTPLEETLRRDLADGAREHARDEQYSFVGPVEIGFETDESLTPGMFLLVGEIRESEGGRALGALVLPDGGRRELGEVPLTIGRQPECDVVLTDVNASRQHAEVRRQGTDFVVVDLGSTNGTRVNGSGVKEHTLVDGDQITIGTTTLRFEAS